MSVYTLSLCIFFFFILLLGKSTSSVDPEYQKCVPTNCGNGHSISYPFYIRDSDNQFICGYPGFEVTCGENGYPLLHIPDNNYTIDQINYGNNTFRVLNTAVSRSGRDCVPEIRNTTLERDKFQFVSEFNLFLFSNCSSELPPELYGDGCGGGRRLVVMGNDGRLGLAEEECGGKVVVPVEEYGGGDGGFAEYLEILRRGFLLRWTAGDCTVCTASGGRCGFDMDSYHFNCFCPDRPHAKRCNTRKTHKTMILSTVIPGGSIIILLVMLLIWCHSKVSSYLLSRNISSKADVEGGNVYFGVSVFSYSELQEATNNFDETKELGDGGFGTVYHGKLHDGREVAVKRLYEHNYKRMEQFMNEIEILTRLHHRNLVSLYGCTSHRSRDLLLVYEYIPNGTVADHLHGNRSKPSPLPWTARINIAIETASALTYLHASDIIHRDVKTNNILLDDNFCVKVADFGLSRLFPTDVTHVSTAPQGTPGYVDPEYHQCYQLTDKSDVYSFGVVLVELISSMQAVDMGRHRHEINLANLAMNRIQRCAFNDLIDPSIGFKSDLRVRRMAIAVAELAFRCLQPEKEMRPAMDEILEALNEIRDFEFEETGEDGDRSGSLRESEKPPLSPESENVVLLKNVKLQPPSPISVADAWVSSSTTTSSSR